MASSKSKPQAPYLITSTPIFARDLPDGRRELTRDFVAILYYADDTVERYVIPAGFKWDGASVPRFFWSRFGHPYDYIHDKPGLWHDAAYSALFAAQGMTREKADLVYRTWIRSNGASPRQARLEWAGVYFFGKSHWEAPTKTKTENARG